MQPFLWLVCFVFLFACLVLQAMKEANGLANRVMLFLGHPSLVYLFHLLCVDLGEMPMIIPFLPMSYFPPINEAILFIKHGLHFR